MRCALSLTIFIDIAKENKISVRRECLAISETVSRPRKIKSEKSPLALATKLRWSLLERFDEIWNQIAADWRGDGKGEREHVGDTLKLGHGEEEESEKMDLEKKGGSLCFLIEVWFTYNVLHL